tara:strand:- start:4023 stop:4520 length:498 start_codon:yes stop_codon:yes gene_type:complete
MKINLSSILILFSALLFLSSCSHKISRTGYTLDKSQHKDCEIPIKKNYTVNESEAQLVGKIKLSDTGFSTSCNEEKALAILKGEACAKEADLIVITEETRPNFGSSCYRCEAEFYRFTSEEKPKIKSDADSYDLALRTTEDKKKNKTLFWVSFAIGFMIGFIAVQ